MLIFNRGINKSFLIGDDIEISILDVDVNKKTVRVGINAPRSLPVHRKEIWEKIKYGKMDRRRRPNR